MTCRVGTDVEQAASILARGGLVAFATETVYGLGANALDPRAVARIFDVKQRPHFDPLIVHVADPNGLTRLVTAIPPAARRLADLFWPGPLSIVLPKAEHVPDLVTAGLPNVAVRIPAHPMARDLIEWTGHPIAAPSANLFGQVSPTSAQHVVEQLGDRIDYILDGGPCAVGLESTVLDLSGDTPTLLRPGGLPLEYIEQAIGPVTRVDSFADVSAAQRAPGMLAKHYATRTPLVLIEVNAPLPNAGRIGLLAISPEPNLDRFAAVEILSSRGDLIEAAANLFAAMRRLDASSLDRIVARHAPNIGLGRAINDRLGRAASAESNH
jgi:L-threonylcarbamoyladenylate synthase